MLGEIGVDLDAVLARQPAVRYCLDWSEQRHHLAGPLGTALADRLFALDWYGAPTGAGWSGSPTRAGSTCPRRSGSLPGWDQPAQFSHPLTA